MLDIGGRDMWTVFSLIKIWDLIIVLYQKCNEQNCFFPVPPAPVSWDCDNGDNPT